MSINKNEIPILEYDTDPNAVIMPDHEHIDTKLPEKAVFAFLGDAVDQYAKAHDATVVTEFISITKVYPIYELEVDGQKICLIQAPVGAPAATQILDWLISYGVRKIISGGSCGVLENMEENTFLVPNKAMRDEGTSYHYLPASRFVDISKDARSAIEKELFWEIGKMKAVISASFENRSETFTVEFSVSENQYAMLISGIDEICVFPLKSLYGMQVNYQPVVVDVK